MSNKSSNVVNLSIIVPYYLPSVSYGGPVLSVKGVSQLCDKFRIDYQIACSNVYYDSRKQISQDAAVPSVCYLPNSPVSWFIYALSITKKFSSVYLNSFFHYNSSFCVVFGLCVSSLIFRGPRDFKVFISPRGELLSPRILAKKRFLKVVYISLFKRILMMSRFRIVFIASSAEERMSISKYFSGFEINIVPNLISSISSLKNTISKPAGSNYRKLSDPGRTLNFIYFSRISPEKGLHNILKDLLLLDFDFTFNVYGSSVSPQYLSKCVQASSVGSLKGKVFFHGAYGRSDIPVICADADIFLYRPIAENFSHAFFEALMCHVVPVVPDVIPWRFGLLELDDFVFYDSNKSGSMISHLLAYRNLAHHDRHLIKQLMVEADLPGKITCEAESIWSSILFPSLSIGAKHF